ncbi:MAG: hypothetical protein WD066_16485 [Planctomycetaceae bacterium]
MRLLYFLFDRDDRLHKAPRRAVEELWKKRRRAEEFRFDLGDDLRMITVIADDDLRPVVTFFLKVDLEDGEITDSSRIEAFEAVGRRDRRRYDTDTARRQFAGWPADWQRQLAVALDFPAREFRRIGLGGPLLMADLWGISLKKVLDYFEQAHEGRDQDD